MQALLTVSGSRLSLGWFLAVFYLTGPGSGTEREAGVSEWLWEQSCEAQGTGTQQQTECLGQFVDEVRNEDVCSNQSKT